MRQFCDSSRLSSARSRLNSYHVSMLQASRRNGGGYLLEPLRDGGVSSTSAAGVLPRRSFATVAGNTKVWKRYDPNNSTVSREHLSSSGSVFSRRSMKTGKFASASMFSSAMAWFSSSSEGAKTEGKAFLEENKTKADVVCLPSGLQYKILRAGKGSAHPTARTPCDCHYEGKLLNGKKFDSSYDRGAPTAFAPNQVIPGWTEAMQLMVEGDLWELYIPSELAYGDSGVGNGLIPGGATLIFKMEIVKIKGPSVPKK